jgi:hypothetical protein
MWIALPIMAYCAASIMMTVVNKVSFPHCVMEVCAGANGEFGSMWFRDGISR